MKELLKPNAVETNYGEVKSQCEQYCSGGRVCNKVCDEESGSTNNSLPENDDILF